MLLGVVVLLACLLPPVLLDRTLFYDLSLAAVYAVIGLSINVLVGHLGTLSLGHQAFVGIGAFASAWAVTVMGLPFPAGVAIAMVVGALQATLLGALALRVTGLYFALVTLAYGLFAERTLFGLEAISGGAAGRAAPTPTGQGGYVGYYYLCLAALFLVAWLDWRMMGTRAGRAMDAIRNDSRAATVLGVDVTSGLLFGFGVAGAFAGLGGALYGHLNGFVDATDFEFEMALMFVLVAVLGGLRHRTGVVIVSALFGLSDLVVSAIPGLDLALERLDITLPIVVLALAATVGGRAIVAGRRPTATASMAVIVVSAITISPLEVVGVESVLADIPPLRPELFILLLAPTAILVNLARWPGGLGQALDRVARHWGGQGSGVPAVVGDRTADDRA